MIGLSVLLSAGVFACGVFFSNEFLDSPFTLAREDALIIFDRESGDQQFIRKIAVEGPQEDFGFLVPIPTMPKVDEIQDDVFATLVEEYESQRPVRTRLDWGPLEGVFGSAVGGRNKGMDGAVFGGGAALGGAVVTSVELLSQEQIGDFEVSVLKSTDSTALRKWIVDNAYAIPDETSDYLQIYVDKEFFFVVFNFSPVEKNRQLASLSESQIIRIKYNHERIFYPFREALPKSVEESTDGEFRFTPNRDFRVSLLTRNPIVPRLENAYTGENIESLEARAHSQFDYNFNLRFQSTVEDTLGDWASFGVVGEGDWYLSQYQFMHERRPSSDLIFDKYAKGIVFKPTLPPIEYNDFPVGWVLIGILSLAGVLVFRKLYRVIREHG